ncbi:lipopolysaccharide biosynthesis protein [Sulfitobacter pontiacus]|uniref:lipopolysaccharide biosynthesis protein n=1 Tax=Sulfitobacter pontiacus TaxID=60137 RepID=UPI0021A7B088|nr:hypothetical protein [Sulfitobacter pontiacus]UWR20821.1 hypothetical protein K3755_17175 [Sulfitobacter pontiacus]
MTILKRMPTEQEFSGASSVLAVACIVTFGMSLLVILVISYLVPQRWLSTYSEQLGGTFMIALPLVIIVNAYRILGLETLRSLQKIGLYNFSTLFSGLSLLFLVLITWATGCKSVGVTKIFVLAEIMSLILVLYLTFYRKLITFSKFTVSADSIKIHLKLSLVYFLSSSTILAGQIDILIAGSIMPLEQLGIYATAVRLAAVAGLGVISINVRFAPAVAKEYKDNGVESAMNLARVQTRILVPVTLAISVVLAAIGYPILGVFGPIFVDAYPALLIVLCGYVGAAIFGPVGVFLNMTFGQREMVVVTIVELTIVISLCLILVPMYGILGAAAANALSQFARATTATAIIYLRTRQTLSVLSTKPRSAK